MSWTDFLTVERTHIHEAEILFRFVLAIAFGAAIGFERELRERSAGLRTHMITTLAAAMFTVLTYEIFHEFQNAGPQTSGTDPIRLIEAVTAGASFLAAGTIIHGAGKVIGLTTGAGIWLCGAIGIATGAGFYQIAFFGVALTLIVLVALKRIEQHLLETKEPPTD